MKNFVFLFYCFLINHRSIYETTSYKLETIKYCCELGTNYAKSGLNCDTFQTPIAGIMKNEERFCLSSVKSCCKKKHREEECKLGMEDAYDNSNCNTDVSEERKGCCDACKIGLEASSENSPCDLNLGLESLMNGAFKSCCEEKSTSTTSLSTTEKNLIMTTTIKSSKKITEAKMSANTSTTEKRTITEPTLPPLGGVCDIPDICAHLCIKVDDSYRCDCHKGYTLMDDGVSCKLTAEVTLKNRCELHNPCEHRCLDTGVAIKCYCDEGYELAGDRRSCDDVNECTVGLDNCNPITERCVNNDGGFDCLKINNSSSFSADGNDYLDKCPTGYTFNSDKMVCDDVDECQFQLACPYSTSCINTVGSYECEENKLLKCPPGFRFKESIQKCSDIDECTTGENNCDANGQLCLNTKGSFTCIEKSSTRGCSAGFKKNRETHLCEDIDECVEVDNACAVEEKCINEPGGYDCVPKEKTTSIPNKSTSTVKETESTTSAQETRRTSPLSCPEGYRLSSRGFCDDVNECEEDPSACDSNQACENSIGSYICNCKEGYELDPLNTGACVDVNECQTGSNNCGEGQRCDNSPGSYFCARVAGCGTGYTLNTATGLCEDDDECLLRTDNCRNLGSRFTCRNIPGSYRCIQAPRNIVNVNYNNVPFTAVPKISTTSITTTTTISTSAPTTTTPRTINVSPNVIPLIPILSSSPANIPSRPRQVSTYIVPINRRPSGIDPLKRCLPGYKMNANGQCIDIDECENSPCKRSEKCINLQNSFQCVPQKYCTSGYELNEDGTKCEDINECARGLDKCTGNQICKNGPGYHICQCPMGHKLNNRNECEDIDECEFYRGRICSVNSVCQNTIGSYKCACKDGFREIENGCQDIDECKEIPNLCHHRCINVWGSHMCACNKGFTLNTDNRTCTDIDECETFKDRKLCIGTCENIPGSYSCKCPEGYRLGADGATCQDIDECQQNPCPNPDDICFNVRGGYRCQSIQCPPLYVKDPEHKSQCKRISNVCDSYDNQCLQMPRQYSYHFITFVSNLPIPTNEQVKFFQMKGPAWLSSRAEFTVNFKSTWCPNGVRRADQTYFQMDKSYNRAVIALIKPIEGPQDIELQIQMQLYVNNEFQAKLISTIYIFVTEYPF